MREERKPPWPPSSKSKGKQADEAPLAKVLPMYLDGNVRDEKGNVIGHISYKRGLPRDRWPTPEQARKMVRDLQRLVDGAEDPSPSASPEAAPGPPDGEDETR